MIVSFNELHKVQSLNLDTIDILGQIIFLLAWESLLSIVD